MVFHYVFNFQLPVRPMIFVFIGHLNFLFCELPIHIISLLFLVFFSYQKVLCIFEIVINFLQYELQIIYLII